MLDELKIELDRTGLTLRGLALRIIEHDRSLLPPAILKLMLAGRFSKELIEFSSVLLDAVKSERDCASIPAGYAKRRSSRRIPVTSEMRALITSQFSNTAQMSVLERRLFPNMPRTQFQKMMILIMRGEQKTISGSVWSRLSKHFKEIEKDPFRDRDFDYPESEIKMLNAPIRKSSPITYQANINLEPDLDRDRIEGVPTDRDISNYRLGARRAELGYVVISDADFAELHAQRLRTCVSVRRLLVASREAPSGLSIKTVQSWFTGRTIAAERCYLEWVLAAYAGLPTAD